jgi:hypothetical protein
MSQWRDVDADHVRELMEKVREYESDIPRPRDFQSTWEPYSFVPSQHEDFNLNKILRVYGLVRPEPGHVLDYIWWYSGLGGQPFVYARPVNGKRICTREEYGERLNIEMPEMPPLGAEPTFEDSRPYLDHLFFDKTDDGYFEFALFCMKVRRFQLWDHSNSNDRLFILDEEERNKRLKERRLPFRDISTGDCGILSLVDIQPKIQRAGDHGWVRLFNFEINRGFSFCIVEVKWPNRLCRITDEVILASRTQIIF